MGLSDILGDYLKQYLGLSESKKDIVVYGLDIVLTTLIGYLCIIGISWMIGTSHLVIPMLITHSALRVFSGGAHGSKYRYCLSLSIIIFNILGLLLKKALTLFNINLPFIIILNFLILIIGFFIIFKKVPVDVEEKPITSTQQRQKLKNASLAVLMVWYGIVFGLTILSRMKYHSFILATSIGMAWQIITLTEVGSKFVQLYGKCLSKIGI